MLGWPGSRSTTKSRSDVSVYKHVVVRGAAEPVAEQIDHERRQSLLHLGIGIERARVGIDLGTAAVLGGLDRVDLAVHREAVVAGIVHPDPHRKAPGLQVGSDLEGK